MANPSPLFQQLQRLVRSPEFAQIPDKEKARSVQAFLTSNDEEIGQLDPMEQAFVTSRLLNEASPGLAERIGAHLPLTGRAIQAFRGETVPGAAGMIAERGPTAGVVGFGEGLAGEDIRPGLFDLVTNTATREQVIAERRRAIAESPAWSRAALALVGEIAELGTIFAVAGPVADKIVSTAMRPVASMTAEAFLKGSETLARQAATQAFKTHVAKRLTTD